MDFLEQMDSFYIKIGYIVVFLIGYFIVKQRKDLESTIKYCVYFYGIAMLSLAISIPHIFPGNLQDISDLENKKRMLYFLQRNNEAIVETTEAIRDMALITFFMITSVVSMMIKLFKQKKTVQ